MRLKCTKEKQSCSYKVVFENLLIAGGVPSDKPVRISMSIATVHDCYFFIVSDSRSFKQSFITDWLIYMNFVQLFTNVVLLTTTAVSVIAGRLIEKEKYQNANSLKVLGFLLFSFFCLVSQTVDVGGHE